MVTLWIGDFRTKQIQTLYAAAQQTAEYHYIVDSAAEYSWFKNNAVIQLNELALESANVIIMLGLNDCVYSCVWNAFNIDQIAKQYSNDINTLIDDYPKFNFYICSVNPINGNYPFSTHADGIITNEQLTSKITKFNSTIKSNCKATYIDSYSYLVDTGFSARDAIRFTPDTCRIIHTYIINNIQSYDTAAFIPRISAPSRDVDSYTYWLSKTEDGHNPFNMPSNAAYAWGRFYEILGELPTLSSSDPEYWYGYTDDKYKRGDAPKLGAIACWQNGALGGSDSGYVAVVEQIKEDGSIITSEVDSSKQWQLINRVKDTGNWGMTGTYHFQGFIYCPLTVSASKEDLCTKNSYNITVDEMKPNAQYIYSYLSTKGWTINAIAGLLGNLQVESKMSPAAWESTIEGSIINADGTYSLNMTAINNFYSNKGRYPGFGLTQWTPYTNFTDWCSSKSLDYWDIDSQLQRIDWEVDNGDQWIARPSKGYDITFSEFIASRRSSDWLAEAFAFCYERPGSSTGTEAEQNALRAERGANGNFWYNYLSTLPLDISSSRAKVLCFKIDNCTDTNVSVSFLLHNTNIGKCTLLKNHTKVYSKEFNLKTGYKVFTFDKLIPDTDYSIVLEVTGVDGEVITQEFQVKTKQSYPEPIKNIELLPAEDSLNIDSKFNLKVTKPEQLGYWKATSGYDISLIINNNIVKTVTTTDASKDILWTNFTIKDKFGYTCKTADNIQIGVKVWVKTTSNKKLFKDEFICSRPICLLTTPIYVYLNK